MSPYIVSTSMFGMFTTLWDWIVVALKGRKIVVLGERGVGKTRLIRFITSGELTEGYQQTIGTEATASNRLSLSNLELNIKKSVDVPGATGAYAEWKAAFDGADIVLYLVRADRLVGGDAKVEARTRADMKHIKQWLEARGKSRPHFVIVGTHCDLDKKFATISDDKAGDYVDGFRKLPIMSELMALGGGTYLTKLALGSLSTHDGAERLVQQTFSQIIS